MTPRVLDDLKKANPWLVVFKPKSILGWEEAKSAFLKDGPACLDVLALFTDLVRFEALIGNLLSRNDGNMAFYLQLLLAVRNEIENLLSKAHDPDSVARQMEEFSAQSADMTFYGTERILKNRVETLLNNCSAARVVNTSSILQFGNAML